MSRLRLGVNIDHVATLRNARGEHFPDPVLAAQLAIKAGADGITAHLREDRRHIRDADMFGLKKALGNVPLNFEMAATDEMIALAVQIKPHACCLVPEKRAERTTEGGLDVEGAFDVLKPKIEALRSKGIRVSLFIEPVKTQIDAAAALAVPVIEFHTGAFCHAIEAGDNAAADVLIDALHEASVYAHQKTLEPHAGHGITFKSVKQIASLPYIAELNIGHFLIADAVFNGLPQSIQTMRRLMDEART